MKCDCCDVEILQKEWVAEITMKWEGSGNLTLFGQSLPKPRFDFFVNICHACAAVACERHGGIVVNGK